MIDINNRHNFEDLMGCRIETENEWLDKKVNGHICYGKGGGGGQKQQDVPPTLAPYITEVLDRASDLYGLDKQYVPYEGERIVDFTADELAAQDAIRDQVGMGILGDETLGAASTYYDPALDLLGLSGQLSEKAVSEITADELMERMNPYQQAVTDLAKREAAKEAQIYDQKLQAQAAGTGGFGGSRQAILEAQAAADLGTRLSDIQTKGSAAAYQDAVRAAEAQRARQAAGAQAAGGLSQLYGGLGQQALGQAYREAGYLSGLGETQRGMEQARADLAYDEFQKQLNFPDQQLQKFSSLIQGFPFQFTQPQQMPGPFQQTVGTGLAAYGLGRNLGFFSEGGGIKPAVTVENGEVTRNAAIGALAAPLKALGTRGLASLAPFFKRPVDKDVVRTRVPQVDRRTGETLPIGESARRLGMTDDVVTDIYGTTPGREFSAKRTAGTLTGAGLTLPFLFGSEGDTTTTDTAATGTGTAGTAGTAGATGATGTGTKTPDYLLAYKDSIDLLKERRADIAEQREEGKAAVEEAFNLQLISLGTLVATTPPNELHKKLPSEIKKFTKKKDLAELQDKYDKKELTNLLAQASIGESLSKIVSELGGSDLPTGLSTELKNTVDLVLGPGMSSSDQGRDAYQAGLAAVRQLSKKAGGDSGIRTQTMINAMLPYRTAVGSKTVDTVTAANFAQTLNPGTGGTP